MYVTLVAIVLWIKGLPEYLYQYEPDFLLESYDFREHLGLPRSLIGRTIALKPVQLIPSLKRDCWQ